ncbi:MAG: hypothetical protein ISQ53_08215 [Synechococcus sp. BS307-5m-G39]|nr:hypothetical protein [Synechococcus sp. BS307-5m-G39]OUX73197.1 MAG: hypothetical protein CBC50_03705 [Synechococcus sp. TMED90]|tara:strand:+ start:475 stop:984 length:510 start_codon:yes stop_codon:yes gene_type:complete
MDMNAPIEIPATFEPSLPLDSSVLDEPLVLDGTVQQFDPVLRAADLAATMPRQWCGSYKSFTSGNAVDVKLTLASVQPIGQMVDLRGDMVIAGVSTPVQGNLNATSDQLDLLPLAGELADDLEAGGDFLGLQGMSLSGWQAPRLTSLGGSLSLAPSCSGSETPPIRALW